MKESKEKGKNNLLQQNNEDVLSEISEKEIKNQQNDVDKERLFPG